MVLAKIRAQVVFPTPLGPQKRKACATCPLLIAFFKVPTPAVAPTTNKEYEVDPDIKRIIEDYVNYSLHYAESYAELFNNMIHISMILNTLNLIEVPTAWITFDEMYRNKLRGIDRNLLITGYFKNTKDTLITDGICNKYMNNSPHLLCDCGHLNSAGHDSLYTEIIDKIKDIVDFK